jgi:DNA (cytosine-5)-methyltransferase 1
MKTSFELVDLFAGAGGTSEGAEQALRALGYKPHLTAVNHWDIAVATHTANHPDASHFCASVDSLNPREIFKGTKIDLLWASPECTHHSNARGGAPVNDQSRATAWCVVRWAEALKPGVVLVENVPEFANWGPTTCGTHPRPIKSQKGQTFRAWINAMESLGYRSDHTLLCAADFGDPTTRRRLFVQFVRGRRNIVWPEPTHGKTTEDLFGERLPWRGAKEIIDWSKKGTSIYGRKKPLADNTMRRILAGLKQYGMKDFVLGQQNCSAARSVNDPVPTISTAGAISLIHPYIVEWDQQNSSGGVHDADDPLSTVCTKARHGVAQPYLVEYHGDAEGAERVKSVEDPLPTVDCSPRFGIARPYLVELHGTSRHQCENSEPFLVSYYGNGGATSVDDPLPTVTCKDRFGLARPVIELRGKRYEVDILFRMLNAKELARAMGFPPDYLFTGNSTEIVKQIGNAVPIRLSRALVAAVQSQDPSAPKKLFSNEAL